MSSVFAPVYKRNFILLFDYFLKKNLKTETRLTQNEHLRKVHNIVTGTMEKRVDMAKMVFHVGDIIYDTLSPGCCLLNCVAIIMSEEIFHS
jgi:hypothetical protein